MLLCMYVLYIRTYMHVSATYCMLLYVRGVLPSDSSDGSFLLTVQRLTQGDVYDTKEAVIIHEELEKGCVVLLTNRCVCTYVRG